MASDDALRRADADELDDGSTVVLSDVLNLVFDKGVVITGSVTIGIADIDLVRVSLDLIISSVETDDRRRRGGERAADDLPLLPPPGDQ